MRRVLVGLLMAMASGIVYGLITVGAKAVEAAPVWKALVSSAAAAATLMPFAGKLRIEPAQRWNFVGMTVVGAVVAPLAILYGLQSTEASHAGLILTLELVVSGLLGVLLLREKIRTRGAFGLAALLVAAVLSSLTEAGSGSSNWLGICLVAAAALAFAFDNFLGAQLVEGHRPHGLIAWKSLLAVAPFALGWAALGFPLPKAWWGWLVMVANGSLGVGLASVLQYHALDRAGAARTTALNVPVSALAAAGGGWLVLGEAPGWLDLVALGFVAAGIALLWDPRPKDQARPRRSRKRKAKK